MCCDQDQGSQCRLPFRRGVFGLWKLCDVGAGILERDELAPAGQWDRIVEGAGPAGDSFMRRHPLHAASKANLVSAAHHYLVFRVFQHVSGGCYLVL